MRNDEWFEVLICVLLLAFVLLVSHVQYKARPYHATGFSSDGHVFYEYDDITDGRR